jgi:hypothetical protein
MRSSMNDSYATNREPQPGRSTFNVSESHKTTFNASFLIPFYWDFIYPGEVRRATTRLFVRISNPLEFPLMDNLYVTVHWFDVPFRILWTNFRKFFGERENPGDSIDYTLPTYTGAALNMQGDSTIQRLLDHFGIPHVASFNGPDATCMLSRAYASIYNYWYRDSSIQDSLTLNTGDGPDSINDVALQQRGKRFDYFTNLTPEPQRGDSVTIGGEISTDVVTGQDVAVYSTNNSAWRHLDADDALVDLSGTSGTQSEALYPNTTINELRNAVALQQFLERDNRAGQRFGDLIRAHYGTEFLDTKYAPGYVAGGRAPLVITPVMNSAADSGATGSEQALGELGAIGAGTFEGARFTYRATEPSILMGIVSVDADLTYHQGLNKKLQYSTRYDFIWPEFQGIGDQTVLTNEIYYQNNASDDVVFGYQPRYEEGRIGINRLSREFRPDYSASLDTWHVAQDFVGTPTLNDTFIKASVPMGRVVQTSTVDHFLADIHTEMYSTKALSLNGVPGLARL